MKPLACIVADDNPSDRFLYGKMLSDIGHDVKALASNGDELIKKTHEIYPDFILTDINMPIKNGIDAARQIKEEVAQKTKIICVTGNDIWPNTFEIAKSHIDGYLLKGFHALKLKEAINSVWTSQFYIDNLLHAKIAKSFSYEDISEISEELKESAGRSVNIEHAGKTIKISDRQVLLMSALFYSKSKEEIAEMLFIEPQSVSQNIKRLKEKFNVNDRMELFRIFMKYGLIDNVMYFSSNESKEEKLNDTNT